jgi:hypothetical protein
MWTGLSSLGLRNTRGLVFSLRQTAMCSLVFLVFFVCVCVCIQHNITKMYGARRNCPKTNRLDFGLIWANIGWEISKRLSCFAGQRTWMRNYPLYNLCMIRDIMCWRRLAEVWVPSSFTYIIFYLQIQELHIMRRINNFRPSCRWLEVLKRIFWI